jgi:diadenosine tetraphosphatase ApaH/serine/threonine PP2A family protein phosphatase
LLLQRLPLLSLGAQVYGFCQETGRKYGVPDAWNAIMHVFDALCIAAVIEGTILCLHGGLSPSLQRLEQLWLVDRFKEPPPEVTRVRSARRRVIRLMPCRVLFPT